MIVTGLDSVGLSRLPSEVLTASFRGVVALTFGAAAGALGAGAGVFGVPGTGVAANLGVRLMVEGVPVAREVAFRGALGAVVLLAAVGVRVAGDDVVFSRD